MTADEIKRITARRTTADERKGIYVRSERVTADEIRRTAADGIKRKGRDCLGPKMGIAVRTVMSRVCFLSD